jgi:hypothetical protein
MSTDRMRDETAAQILADIRSHAEREPPPRLPTYIPQSLADMVIAELGALPEGVEVSKMLPEHPPMHIMIVGAGSDSRAARLTEQLRESMKGASITITLHDRIPPDMEASVDLERGTVSLSKYVGRALISAQAGMVECAPREGKRKAQWKSEIAGRPRK